MMLKVDESNIENANKLEKMGGEVRNFPFEGVRLQIVDEKKTLLAVNNPSLPYERVALEVEDEKFSKSMKYMFEGVWDKAKSLEEKV